MAEVAFEGVAVDHDPVFVAFGGDSVAEVLAVGVALGAEVGDDDGDALEHPLEFLGQGVDRVGDKRLELVQLGLLGHPRNAIRSVQPAQGRRTFTHMIGGHDID